MRLDMLTPPYQGIDAERVSEWVPPGGEPLHVVRLLLGQHPDLAAAIRSLGFFFAGEQSLLPARERELVVCRVTARLGCAYEWGIRAALMPETGKLGPDEVAATVRVPLGEGFWSPADRALLDLVDQLHETGHVEQDTFLAVQQTFSDAQIVEVLALAGWYHVVAYLANGTEMPPEPFAAPFPGATA